MKTILRICILIPVVLFSSCEKKGSNPVDATPSPPSTSGGKITTGQTVDLGSQTIGTSGGSFTVNKSGDPLNGFQITVPANGFTQPQSFAVSYAPITSHQLGSSINPLSPLIKISCLGGYSSDQITVKVPIKLPAGSFAMGFFCDETTGELEPLPVAALDSTSITIATRHFSPSDAQLGKGLLKRTGTVTGNILVSYILKSLLHGQSVISSGFTPGVDDWEFPNYGSYISPKGHCAGQSATAIWYYYEHKLKGEPGLNHRYDKVKADWFWPDNPMGYRFASAIQEDMWWWGRIASTTVSYYFPDVVFDSFVYSMIVTGKPQMMGVTSTAENVAHEMVVYKIDVFGGKLYVADPNYPGNTTRVVEFVPGVIYGSFKPYSSELKAGEKGTNFDWIQHDGVTSLVSWPKIAQRWTEFQNGTIGNDRFPSYSLTETRNNTEFADGLDTDLDSVKVSSVSNACAFPLPGTSNRQFMMAYDAQGTWLDTTKAQGVLSLGLKPGDNTFGMHMWGCAADTHLHYLDFKWIKVHRHMTLTIATTESNGAPVSTSGTKNKVYTFVAKSARPVPKDGNVRYDWTFDNGTTVTSVNNDSTITHSFAQDGAYTVGVTFYYSGTNISKASATAAIATTVPLITSVVPSSGKIADTVKVKGKYFGSDPTKGSVTFTSGVVATGVIAWLDTIITVKVPQNAQSGPLTVTVNGQASNTVPFTLLSPSITSLVPSTGKVSDTVKVQGKYFGGDKTKGTVTFNGVGAPGILSWVDTLIKVTVPQGALTGAVIVTVNGAASVGVNFTVTTTGPVITSLVPNTARMNDTIAVRGRNFGSDKASGSVQFSATGSGSSPAVVSWVDTTIRVIVPYYAITGPLSVTAKGVRSNQVTFTMDSSPWLDAVYHVGSYLFGYPKMNWAFPSQLITATGRNIGGSDTIMIGNLAAWPYDSPGVVGTIPSTAPLGPVNVWVKTYSGQTTNSKPFYIGVPPDTLRAYSAISFGLSMIVTYGEQGFGSNNFSYVSFAATGDAIWGSDGFTATVSNAERTMTGTLKVTLPLGALSITKLELSYQSLAPPYTTFQMVAENVPYGSGGTDWGYGLADFYYLKSHMTKLTGTITPNQTAVAITGITDVLHASGLSVSFVGLKPP